MNETATASLLRSINRSAILDLMRQSGPIARSQIARRLHMSLPTVMRIVDELIAVDLVRPHGTSEPTGGRPRSLLEFNGQAYAVIGVDLGGTRISGALADLAGNIQYESDIPHEPGAAEANLERLYALLEQLLSVPRPAGQRLRGIGIGAPSVTLAPDGIVDWSPSLGWRNLPLKALLGERLGLPVFVENDVNLAALGELHFGAGRGTRNLVCVSIGTGIGAGIIIGGTLYRGHSQAAGEIGYLLPGVEFLRQHYEQFGALEGLASSGGLVERARRLLAGQGAPPPAEGWGVDDVLAAARKGAPWARQVVSETVDYLSLAVGSITSLLNPEVITLVGELAHAADLLFEPIHRRLEGVVPSLPRLVASPLQGRAVVMGAIVLVLNATMESFVVNRLP